jgi:putative transposase
MKVAAVAVNRKTPTFLRASLEHVAPSWVKPGSLFFVTVCCEPRGTGQLCHPAVSYPLLESVRFYHEHGRWFSRLFLLMPDHVHALLAFPPDEKMSEVMRNWKNYTARKYGIVWQRNFFDHRLRSDESWTEKAAYIRKNPVRAGLISAGASWPHIYEA